MANILNSELYFIFLTLGAYSFFTQLSKKIKHALFNPLLITSIFLIIYLVIYNLLTNGDLIETTKGYTSKMTIINAMLSPLTVCLAIPIYTRWLIIKQYWKPILVGTIVGCTVSIVSVVVLGKLFNLDKEMISSLIPKSVTTAIAVEISDSIGGIRAITVSAVILTGILGALFGPLLCKILGLKRSPTIGVSYGATSHAVGTSKAVEVSTRTGAISSVAIVTSGILTVLIALFIK